MAGMRPAAPTTGEELLGPDLWDLLQFDEKNDFF